MKRPFRQGWNAIVVSSLIVGAAVVWLFASPAGDVVAAVWLAFWGCALLGECI